MKTSHCHRRWFPFWKNYKKASLSSMMWSLVLADGSSLSFNNGLPGQCPESWQFDNIPVFLVKLHKGFGHQCLWALTVAEYRPVHRWEKGNLTPRLFPSNKEVHQCSETQCPVHWQRSAEYTRASTPPTKESMPMRCCWTLTVAEHSAPYSD